MRGIQASVSAMNFGSAASRAGVPASPVFVYSLDVRSLSVISGAIAWHNALSAALVSEAAVGDVDGWAVGVAGGEDCPPRTTDTINAAAAKTTATVASVMAM